MKALHCVGVVALLVSVASAQEYMPSFDLGFNSWQATHIIVVTEGDKIDGVVEVLESWKGDLKKGDKLTLPDLAAFAPEKERVVSQGAKKEKELAASISGSRMVLFLQKQEEAEKGKSTEATWLFAALGNKREGMKGSVAWIEGDKTFAFDKENYDDPLKLRSYGLDEKEMKKKVDAVVKARTTLAGALEKGDEEKILATTQEVFRANPGNLLDLSVTEDLGRSGRKALPTLRALLKDDKLAVSPQMVISAMVRVVGSDGLGPELVTVLEQELTFWQKTGPDLPKGWLKGADGKFKRAEAERLWWHANLAHYSAWYLGRVKYSPGRDAVSQFGKFWKSLPQLDEAMDLAKECDDALKRLPKR